MERITLQNGVDEGLSISMLSVKFSVSRSTIRYWLGKYNLKTIRNVSSNTCTSCNKNLSDKKFYKRNGKNR